MLIEVIMVGIIIAAAIILIRKINKFASNIVILVTAIGSNVIDSTVRPFAMVLMGVGMISLFYDLVMLKE